MIQKPVSLHSVQSERHALSSLVKFPDIYPEIESYVKELDFNNETHAIIYRVIKNSFSQKENLNSVLLAAKIKNLGINKFENDLDIEDYVSSLYTLPVKKEDGPGHFKTIVNLRIRRDINALGAKIAEEARSPKNENVGTLITSVDKLYADTIKASIDLESNKVINIFSDIKDVVEGIANNPPDPNQFLAGPFPLLFEMVGSLHRPSNITLYAARSKAGKSQLLFFINVWMAEKYGLPIYWADSGELTYKEMQMRAVSCLSGGQIPMSHVERGTWRKNAEMVRVMRSLWPRVEKIKFYHEDISRKKPNQIISAARRFAYNTVGRGNPFIWCIDYLKPFADKGGKQEWEVFGEYVEDIKLFINNELPINVQTAIQNNRKGINVSGRPNPEADSEDAISQDRVTSQISHGLILRKKNDVEVLNDGGFENGNMSLAWPICRHLGENVERAERYVKDLEGNFRPNRLNLSKNNFHFEEIGDLVQMYEQLKDKHDIQDGSNDGSDDMKL